MSVWSNKINRTILVSSIFFVLILAVIILFAVYPYEDRPTAGINWVFKPWAWVTLIGFLFWGIYFNSILLVGSIREKMDALPGWTEIIICMLLTLLPAIFIGYLANYDTSGIPEDGNMLTILKWMAFIIALGGVILITLWVLMSKTSREETTVAGT
ncbi:MAG: hypothetical protein JXA54_00955 [Candidatus Heimdallarchaeota archaeon]|nr:hypothetical protein [Candidatus Heimdallarchaeota archaeon]